LAPLHNHRGLATLELLRSLRPDVTHFACFDTAFHHTLPDSASLYAVPAQWTERLGVRRFGFHGLSHAYASRRAGELLGRDASRMVTCHLGAGASLAAVRDGRSVDTTMGFTALEGLVMATRSGSVDPGAILWLVRHAGLSADEVEHGLQHDSGLQGLAGSADMREVIARADGGDPRARTALEVYLHRLRGQIGAMAAALGGVDALVFTGGVGERSARIRAEACLGLGFLGVAIDGDANVAADGDAVLTGREATADVLSVATREDLEIAAEVRRLT
jgi:acetate kinase